MRERSRIEQAKEAAALEIDAHLKASREAVDRSTPQEMVVRPIGRKEDLRFVLGTWMDNYKKGALVKKIRDEVYADGWHAVLEQVVPRARILIACHPEAPDVCFGWICGEVIQGGPDPRPTLMVHYCYVKHRFKAKRDKHEGGYAGGHGVGRMLLKTLTEGEKELAAVVYTAHTSQGAGWMERMWMEGVIPHKPEYDPFLLLTTLPRGWY